MELAVRGRTATNPPDRPARQTQVLLRPLLPGTRGIPSPLRCLVTLRGQPLSLQHLPGHHPPIALQTRKHSGSPDVTRM